MQLAMIREEIIPLEEVPDIYFDRGFFFGDGVYEVVRSYNGKIFSLDDHMARFARSLDAIDIKGVDIEDIRAKVEKAYEAAGIANAKIYFHITRGSAPRNHGWDEQMKPAFFLTVTEMPDNKAIKAEGVAVSTYPDLRWKRCDIKSLNLLANVMAKQDASSKGCFEAILVDEAGLITEGSSSAFFSVFEGKLQTAPLTSNILPSITRKHVVKAAEQLEIELVEKSITPARAVEADELFIAVTTSDIVPVVKLDDTRIGDGKPGPVTGRLIEQFRSFLQ